MRITQRYKQYTSGNLRSLIVVSSIAAVISSCSVLPRKQNVAPLSWQKFDTNFAQLAEQSSFLAAEIKAGECDPVHEMEAELSLGVGSSFKLYILSELANQIAKKNMPIENAAKGEHYLSWNSLLPIQQSFKSIPGGSLLFVPDNTPYTLRYFAEQMIQRSDNTATDHLLFLLGREQIEKRMLLDGHHNPQLNIPLLATREFAVLKFLYNDSELADYLALTTVNKRAVLDQEQRGYRQLDQYFHAHGEQQEPIRLDSLEWFANRFDMCSVLQSLHTAAKLHNMPQITEILSLEDPLNTDREQWIYVGFKGGSELGVLAGNWLLQRKDGRLFVLSVALNNKSGAIDTQAAIMLLKSAVELLGQTP